MNKDKFQTTLFEDAPKYGGGYSIEILRWMIAKIAESSPAALSDFINNQLKSGLEKTYLNHHKLGMQYAELLDLVNNKNEDKTRIIA